MMNKQKIFYKLLMQIKIAKVVGLEGAAGCITTKGISSR